MKNKIKAIIFDVGGVLAINSRASQRQIGPHHNLGVHESIAKKLNISLDQYFDSIDTTYAKSIIGELPRKNTIKIIAKNLRISKRKLKKLYYESYGKNFKQNQQLFEQAFQLKQQGYQIAVLSDQWHLSKDALMPRKLYRKFNPVIVSCDKKVAMRKPNPKIYRLILKKLKLKPSQTIFIDNQEWNIKPAEKIGMKTIIFENNTQLFKNKLWRSLFK